MIDITYRTANEKDAEKMVAVHFDSVHAIKDDVYPKEIINAWSPTPDVERTNWLKGIICNENAECFVAINESNAVIGFSIFIKNNATLKALYVSPEYERRGVGKKLVSLIEQAAKKIEIYTINLKASLNAVKFYKKVGFVELGRGEQVLANG